MEIKIKHIIWAILIGLYLWGFKLDFQEHNYFILKAIWGLTTLILAIVACILIVALPATYIKENNINGETKLFKINLWKKEK